MSILITALLASAQPMPFIDRASLRTLSAIEALQPESAQERKVGSAKALLSGDVQMIGTVCGAAGKASDPAKFLSILATSYAMSADEEAALRHSCAVYLTGEANAAARPIWAR